MELHKHSNEPAGCLMQAACPVVVAAERRKQLSASHDGHPYVDTCSLAPRGMLPMLGLQRLLNVPAAAESPTAPHQNLCQHTCLLLLQQPGQRLHAALYWYLLDDTHKLMPRTAVGPTAPATQSSKPPLTCRASVPAR